MAMNPKQLAGFIFSFIAFVVMIIAVATMDWFVQSFSNSTFYAGLKKYSIVSGSNSQNGNLKDLPSNQCSICSRLDKGGTDVIIVSTFALISLILSMLFIGLSMTKSSVESSRKLRYDIASIVAVLFCTFFVLLGVILYGQQVYVGYSYIVFLAAGFLYLCSSAMFIASLVSTGSKQTQYYPLVGLLLLVAAFIASLSAMATQAWFYEAFTDNSGYSDILQLGLVTYSFSSSKNGQTFTKTGNLKDEPNYSSYYDGGQSVLGCGIPLLIIAFVLIILIMFVLTRKPERYRLRNYIGLALVGTLICGGLDILAIILYAKKLNVGFSYLIYIITSFISFSSAFLLGAATFGEKNTAIDSRQSQPHPPPS